MLATERLLLGGMNTLRANVRKISFVSETISAGDASC